MLKVCFPRLKIHMHPLFVTISNMLRLSFQGDQGNLLTLDLVVGFIKLMTCPFLSVV